MARLPRPQDYDAIVVGSGASGGWAAKRMSEAGMRVALVCAGRPLNDGDYREHVQPYELKYMARANDLIRRSRPVQKDCYACTEYNESWFCNDIDEPYTTRAGQAVFVAGPHARHRRAHQRLGPAQLSLLAAGSEGLFLRRPGRRLAARLQGPRQVLRAGRRLCRHLRHGREPPRAARQQVPCRRCRSPASRQKVRGAIKSKFGRTLTMGRLANITGRSTDVRPATTAAPASAAASRIPISTPRSPPSPTRSRPATARTSRTPWSIR